MIGLNTENAIVMMNWMPTMTQSVHCHCATASDWSWLSIASIRFSAMLRVAPITAWCGRIAAF
jgi:hypothetical protein